jgi:hypothetical protein
MGLEDYPLHVKHVATSLVKRHARYQRALKHALDSYQQADLDTRGFPEHFVRILRYS